LLVEDNPADVGMFRFALEQIGAEVNLIVLRDGKEAMDYLSGQTHSEEFNRRTFVVLDLNVPKANGFEVLAFIRADEKLKGLRVVVMSGSSDASEAQHCYAAGADAYFGKPTDLDDIVATAARIVEFANNQTAVSERIQE
jgi:CheY-like chemotaxis protein